MAQLAHLTNRVGMPAFGYVDYIYYIVISKLVERCDWLLGSCNNVTVTLGYI